MADLEAVLADVSYLMAMEKSKSTPAARASKKIVLPDPRAMVAWWPSLTSERKVIGSIPDFPKDPQCVRACCTSNPLGQIL
ncbi:hypothetical protein AVEN_137280-1 [Araneus ventricosus]|uniref:Uncharacterized protein n=1 Tax=Araneus ventricosus TaxID=182803 RepID=A0A4Y2DQ12_ARAVE|nr:hypothetical protein AVEN_137280-1 [Araneus ventricosus]